jgi:hypothetical protein
MVAGGTIKDCMIILPQGGLFVMYEEQEAQALKQALESVDFCVDGKHCELLAKVTGQKLDKDFLKLIFADTLRQDLRLDNADIADKICPPSNGDWQRILADKPELSAMVDESIQAAFRFGYYYAMHESGVNWQPCEKLEPVDGETVVSPYCDETLSPSEFGIMQESKYITGQPMPISKYEAQEDLDWIERQRKMQLHDFAMDMMKQENPEAYAELVARAEKQHEDSLPF